MDVYGYAICKLMLKAENYDYQVLLDNNISLKRYTQCECRPNNFGRKLLEMCKSALAIFEKYCHHWKLKVNLQKTKVIIFCKRE